METYSNILQKLLPFLFSGSRFLSFRRLFYPFSSILDINYNLRSFGIAKMLLGLGYFNASSSLHKTLIEVAEVARKQTFDNFSEIGYDKVTISRTFNAQNYTIQMRHPLERFYRYVKEKLEPFLVNAYIHGSLSTLDYTGFSDLDTLFIIKNEALKEVDVVKSLEMRFIYSQRFIYEVDPLQHHGHFFLLESELNGYSQSFLPLSALRMATSLLDNETELLVRLCDSSQGSIDRFATSVRVVNQYLFQRKKKLLNPYYLKSVLSHFMILPALFLQLKNDYISKRESFVRLREMVPEQVWHSMQRASAIRQMWNQQYISTKRLIVRFIGLWNPLLLPFYAKKIYRCNPLPDEIIHDEFLSSTAVFTNYLVKQSGLNEFDLSSK